jgi:hypothetical protein
MSHVSVPASNDSMASQTDSSPEWPARIVRRNMTACILLDTIFMTGWADLVLVGGPLLVYLNASNRVMGLINGAMFAGLFGMIVSPWISRRFPVKKWYLFIVNVPYLFPIAVMSIVLFPLLIWLLKPLSCDVQAYS